MFAHEAKNEVFFFFLLRLCLRIQKLCLCDHVSVIHAGPRTKPSCAKTLELTSASVANESKILMGEGGSQLDGDPHNEVGRGSVANLLIGDFHPLAAKQKVSDGAPVAVVEPGHDKEKMNG